MKRVALWLAAVLTLGVLAGCGVFTGFRVCPDPAVEDMWLAMDPDSGLSVLNVEFVNFGGAGTVDYEICLSPTLQVKPSTALPLYRSAVAIGRNSDALVDLTFRDDVVPYVTANGLLFPNGDFYLAAAVDPDDNLAERYEADNYGVIGPFRFRDGEAGEVYGDMYESDDAPPALTPEPDPAAQLPLDTYQERSFHAHGDVDWMWFHAEAGRTVRVRTFPGRGLPADTELWVYDSAVPFQPGFDPYDWFTYPPIRFCDDDGFDHYNGISGMDEPWDDPDTDAVYSAVRFTAPYTGIYLVCVDEFGDQEGSYRVHFFVE